MDGRLDTHLDSVSVVIPVYNSVNTIQATLDSLSRQTRLPDELILIDDWSQDDSLEYCRQWSKSAGITVTVEQLTQKGGVSVARNTGARMAQSKWVLFMDADDICQPDFLQYTLMKCRQRGSVTSRPVVLAFCSYDQIDEHGQRISDPIAFQQLEPEEVFGYLLVRNFISTSGLLVDRTFFLENGGFNPDITLSEDWELWMRLAQQEMEWVYVDRPLISVRRYSGNTSGKVNRLNEAVKSILRQYSQDQITRAIHRRHLPWADNQADLASVLYRIDQWDAGLQAVQNALKRGCSTASLHFQAALYDLHQRDRFSAKSHFETAIQKDSHHYAALNNLAALYALEGEREKALDMLQTVLQDYPDYLDACHNLKSIRDRAVLNWEDLHFTWQPLRKVLIQYNAY